MYDQVGLELSSLALDFIAALRLCLRICLRISLSRKDAKAQREEGDVFEGVKWCFMPGGQAQPLPGLAGPGLRDKTTNRPGGPTQQRETQTGLAPEAGWHLGLNRNPGTPNQGCQTKAGSRRSATIGTGAEQRPNLNPQG